MQMARFVWSDSPSASVCNHSFQWTATSSADSSAVVSCGLEVYLRTYVMTGMRSLGTPEARSLRGRTPYVVVIASLSRQGQALLAGNPSA